MSNNPAEILDRLDNLPFTRKHRKIIFASGLGWAFDAMDVGLITYIIAVLTKQWGLSATEQSLIVSAGFIGMAVGATFGGALADRVGRRTVFTVTLVVYGIATGASAFVGGVLPLIILRILVGLGLGAELPVASTLVQEVSPRRIRGSITVWLEAFWALGWTVAALIGYFVVPLSDNGWRIAFAIGALPALYAIVLRWHLPESVRFLLHRGENEKAARVTDELADGHDPIIPTDDEVAEAASLEKPTWGNLFSPALRQRTVGIWTVWFMVNLGYYGSSIWIPSILHANGHDLVKSFGFTLIITLAQLPGYATSAYLIEHWGRRATLTTFLVGSSIGAIGFGMADSSAAIIATGCVLSFFNLGAWGALYAITPEIYPTFIRATGAGAATGFGRLASIAAPFLVTFLLGVGGVPGGNKGLLFPVLAGAFVVAAAATFALPERRGQSLS